MPIEQPGRRFSAIATKATSHGKPAVELNHPGIAAKSAQIAAMAPSTANAALAVQIAVGEDFVIMLDGVHEVVTTDLPAGAAAGDGLYIKAVDALTGGVLNAGFLRFGVIDVIDTTLGRALVNLSLRGTF